jgi:hypothetical protein
MADDEYRLFQLHLLQRPEAGDTIRGSGGLRKIRWNLPGRGKRGGARIIYYWTQTGRRLYLLFMYPKNVRSDLTMKQLQQLRELITHE